MGLRIKLFIVTLVMMLSFVVTGCNEISPWLKGCDAVDYIEVVVNTEACIAASDGKVPVNSIMWSGAQLHIEIVKAGGEKVTFDKTTDSGGCTESVQGIFKVYRKQPVQVMVRPIGGNLPSLLGGVEWSGSDYRVSNNVKTLNWTDIYPAKDFGDTYYWNPLIQMLVEPTN